MWQIPFSYAENAPALWSASRKGRRLKICRPYYKWLILVYCAWRCYNVSVSFRLRNICDLDWRLQYHLFLPCKRFRYYGAWKVRSSDVKISLFFSKLCWSFLNGGPFKMNELVFWTFASIKMWYFFSVTYNIPMLSW
jgi:hypothetical protein